MTTDPKLVAQFFEYTPMDLALLEERAVTELYEAKKTRWKYRRELQLALEDYETDCQIRAPNSNPTQQPQPPTPQAVMAGLVAAPFVLAGGLALFFLALWVLTGGPSR